jgi:hypothetical protein
MRLFLIVAIGAVVGYDPAVAQTSSELVRANPTSTYLFLKKKAQASQSGFAPEDSKGLGYPELSDDCPGPENSSFDPDDEDHYERLSTLARRTAFIEGSLSATPTALWREDVSRFEREIIAAISGSRSLPSRYRPVVFERALEKKIATALRKRYKAPTCAETLPYVVGFQIAIVTRPLARRVQYIYQYFVELCEFQKIDPKDTQLCDRWNDLESATIGAGRANILVTWMDGVRSDMYKVDFDSLPQRGRVATFVIRR